jgi:hypothetical protein
MTEAAHQQITQDLNALCRRFGLSELPVIEIGPLRTMGDADREGVHGDIAVVTELAERVQEELGAPGQRIFQGQLQTDPNPVYGPMFVRGYSGNPGLYDEVYRTEPLIYDAIRTHTETLVSGTWEIEAPKAITMARTKRAMKKFCEFHNGKLRGIKGGWAQTVEQMASNLLYGFAASELVWALENGRPYIHKIAWRSPSTVYQWIFDERQSELLGCHFRSHSGGSKLDYILPAFAPVRRPWERKLLLQSLGGWGNDVEGVAPMRTVLVLWKIKRLLVQIMALAADTYGIPPLVLSVDMAQLAAGIPAPTREDIDKTWNLIKNLTSLDASKFKMPPGLRLDRLAAGGAMPDLLPMIEYIDRMMLVPFSNEGSLLGMVGGGAYALGVVKERETLRSAPYYARIIAGPINDALRDLVIYEMGPQPDYPKLVWRMDGIEDASVWLADAVKVIGKPLAEWPKLARDVGLEKLKLPPNTFDDYDKEREAHHAAEMAARASGQIPTSPDPTQQEQAAGGGKQAAAQEDGESVTGDAPQDGPERPEVE